MSSYSFQGKSRVWVPRDEEENRAIFSAMRQETGITMPEEFKPVYLENEEYEVEKWSAKQLIKLLRLYGSHRCLWDHKDPYNKNRKMRKAAMIDITAAMGDEVTMEQVIQKINVIRSTYRYEKRRIKQRIRKGVGAKTKLKWFALADSFLRNIPRADKFKKTDAAADSDSDLEDTVVFTIDPEILIPLEEDNSGNQNCISIGDGIQSQAETDSDIKDINEQMDVIHQMLENNNEEERDEEEEEDTPSSEQCNWRSKQSIKFLGIYQEHRCLWDCNDRTYKDRELRGKAILEIAKEMGGGLSEKQVVKKINVLRSTYRMEKRKIAEALAKGTKQQSRLKWYPFADSFLSPFFPLKLPDSTQTTESHVEALNEFNDGDVDMPSDTEHMNDHHSFTESDEEPISKLAHEPIAEIKTESVSDDEKQSANMLPIVRIPKIRIKPIKRPWMQAESLHFVELLRIHGCLWDKQHPNYKIPTKCIVAIQDIAHKMDMSERRIRKKMKILLKTYRAERKKIESARENGVLYTCDLVWFPKVDEFLSRREEPTHLMPPMSFVDPDLMSPAPSLFHDAHDDKKIKQEAPDSPQDSDHFADADDTPARPPTPPPLPPPLPPPPDPPSETNSVPALVDATDDVPCEVESNAVSVIQNGTLVNPFVPAIKTEEPPDEDFPRPESDEPPTKLVWNGLEDDLLEGKWSLKHSVKFLRLYGAHRCLWDLNDPDYRSRDLRNAAMEDIAAAMGHGLDLEYVSKKIKIFRITYMQHRKRMLEALKNGQDPEIQLRWFPLADSFLRPHIGLRSIKPGEPELPQFDFQYVYANLNLIDPALLNDFEGKGTQNSIQLGAQTRTNMNRQSISDDDGFNDEFFKSEERK